MGIRDRRGALAAVEAGDDPGMAMLEFDQDQYEALVAHAPPPPAHQAEIVAANRQGKALSTA